MRLKKLLKHHGADTYIAVIILSFVMLLLGATMFYVAELQIGFYNINRRTGHAAKEVFANIREQSEVVGSVGGRTSSFHSLDAGHTQFIATEDMNNATVAQMIAQGLGGTYENGVVTGYQGGRTFYITDVSYTVIGAVLARDGGYPVGDITHDNKVTEEDALIIDQYLRYREENPTAPFSQFQYEYSITATIYELDVNRDNKVNQSDVKTTKEIAKIFETLAARGSGNSSGIVIISFHIEIPVRFGGTDLGTTSDDVAYVYAISIKEA